MGRRTDTRQRMVDAGVTLFGQCGYTNASLFEVVELAQAPRGSIYYHFPGGKDELAVEVAAAWRYKIEREAARLASRSANVEAFLCAVLDNTRKSLLASDYADGCPMSGIIANVGGGSEEPLRKAVGATFNGWVDALTAGLVSKGLKQKQARHMAVTVVVAIEGAITVSRATCDAAPFADIQEMVGTLLAAAASAPAA